MGGEFFGKVIAVDFDGTLFEAGRYPKYGKADIGLIQALKRLRREQGCKIILWTCREGEALDAAIGACAVYGLQFDAVNENIPERVQRWGDSRKVGADIYIDDRSVNLIPDIFRNDSLRPDKWWEKAKT